jgi:hypothetical protein
MLTATLTSIPPRFFNLHLTIDSLLHQNVPFDRIILNICESYKRYPDWNGDISMIHLWYDNLDKEVQDKIIINRCEDLGASTKCLGCLNIVSDDDILIVCDDDRHYYKDWSEKLYLTYMAMNSKHPICEMGWMWHDVSSEDNMKKAERNTKMFDRGQCEIPLGCGGFICNKKMVQCPDIHKLLTNCPYIRSSDDLLFGYLFKNNNYPLYKVGKGRDPPRTCNNNVDDLWSLSRWQDYDATMRYFKAILF